MLRCPRKLLDVLWSITRYVALVSLTQAPQITMHQEAYGKTHYTYEVIKCAKVASILPVIETGEDQLSLDPDVQSMDSTIVAMTSWSPDVMVP